jgi:translation elongation factor EF-Tu-like GTPase
VLDEAEIEATQAANRDWVATGRPGAVSHEEAMAELLGRITVSMQDDDLPVVLEVESAFRITGRPGTVIMGVIEQGTLRIGDHLELIQPSGLGATSPLRFQCTGFDAAARVSGRNPALGPLIAIVGVGIEPDAIQPGARLQTAL